MQVEIKIPYTTRPHMHRNIGPVFAKIPNPKYLIAKKQELERFGSALYGCTTDAADNNLVAKASTLCSHPATNDIVDFALQFEEDVAIMSQGRLAAICFCFPSSWIPVERLGMTLAEIHAPVADGHRLVHASAKLTDTMADPRQGSFRRQVWTLTNNPALSNHPALRIAEQPQSLNQVYFRLETQTTWPIPNEPASLFFVKVEVVPLMEIWDQHGKDIRDSVMSMTDAVLDYKNLRHIKTLL